MTLTGPRGSQVGVTDGQGEYLFVGVQPATYVLKVELSGFLAQERTDVIVGMGKTVSTDFTLKVGGVSESIEVVGTASTVDVKSSATETSVSSALLTAMPIYSSTATGLLNVAPGINGSSAYGGQGSYGNALLLDGVDTRDPEGGSAWTFFNQNLIEDIQIGGLGAPAEYGGFTGGIVNTITKSGGNLYSGLFSIRYTKGSFASQNVSSSVLQENPSLGSADITNKLVDYTVQMGGPIKQDKAFFFGSVQRYSADYDPIGPRTTNTDVSPRFNMKVTLQPTPSDTLILGLQYDSYNVRGRVGWWSTAQATDSATVTEDAPEWVWNAQYRRVFGTSTLLEAKLTGYKGYYYLDPVDPRPPTYDGETGQYGGGGGGLYYADRGRNQLQVSLSKYAEKYGRHSFKFGAEIERSHVRSQYKPYGPAGYYTYLYGGVPYLPDQLQLRCSGQQPSRVGLRAGSVERRQADAERRPSDGPHPRLQPRPQGGRLQAEERLGPPDRRRVRRDRDGHHRAEGLLGPLLRGRRERVLQRGDAGHRALRHDGHQPRWQPGRFVRSIRPSSTG